MADEQSFTPPGPLNTPVLFLVYKRLDTTIKVFEAIRKAKPPRLYIAADGPRSEKIEEEEKVLAVRKYVLENIDWKCDYFTLFRKRNMGCKYAVSEALDWFFKSEEKGIILEDDVLPNDCFFLYCQDLLDKYQDDKRIGMISGRNNLVGYKEDKYSYLFSQGGSIWGWATWKRVISEFNVDDKLFEDNLLYEYLYNATDDKYISMHFYNAIDRINKGKISSWAYPFGAYLRLNSMLSITPKVNLIDYIGVVNGATHTKPKAINKAYYNIESKNLSFPLKHPQIIVKDRYVSKHQNKSVNRNLFKYYIKKNIFFNFILKANKIKSNLYSEYILRFLSKITY